MIYSTLFKLNNQTFYDVFDDEVISVPVDSDPDIIIEPKPENEPLIESTPDLGFTPYEYNDNEKVVESILTLVIGSWLMILYLPLLYSVCKKCSLRFFPIYSFQDDEEESVYDSDNESYDTLDEHLEIIGNQQEILQRYVEKVKKLEKRVKRMRKQIKTLKKSKVRMDIIEEFVDNFNFDEYRLDD